MTMIERTRARRRPYLSAACGRASHIGRVLLIALSISSVPGLPGMVLASPQSGAYFAEPGSGRRVTKYTVDLAVGRDERKQFRVPQDCDAITEAFAGGFAFSGRIVDRRLWQKATDDCWFYNFLHRHSAGDIADYVSDYDFMNARLSDLPVDRDCIVVPPGAIVHNCGDAIADRHGMLKSFPVVPQHAEKPPSRDPNGEQGGAECGLRDGLFYGELFVQQSSIRCTAGDGRPSLRLIAVDFADINGDRILDAVLRFMPVGPGAARSSLILPLTRLGPDEALSVPDFDNRASQ